MQVFGGKEDYSSESNDSNDNPYWRYKVILNKIEWPTVDTNKDDYLYRPIRVWCEEIDCFFTYYGVIYFRHADDVMAFKLTWDSLDGTSLDSPV